MLFPPFPGGWTSTGVWSQSAVFIFSFIFLSINWYKLVDYPQDHFWCVGSLENRDGIFSRTLWRWLWVVVRGAHFRAGDASFFQSQCFRCSFSHETPLKSSLKCPIIKNMDFKEMLLGFVPSFPTVKGIWCWVGSPGQVKDQPLKGALSETPSMLEKRIFWDMWCPRVQKTQDF